MATAGTAFDVIIVGGGPAGAATAVALARQGLTCALVERRAAPIARVGETLPPAVRVPLEALGLWESFVRDRHEPAAGNRSYWGSAQPDDLQFVATPYGSGWHIDRQRFERTLLEAAAAQGVAIFSGRQLEALAGDGRRWTVSIPEPLTTRFVVDASGRGASLARICGVERVSIDQLVAATLFCGPGVDPFGQVTLIEAVPDGWWYSAPLPDGRLVAAFMTDADIAARETVREPDAWRQRAQLTQATRQRLDARAVEGRPQIASANTSRLASVIGPGWLAVGDAAVSFDPLSSQGIITALESALHAAEAIARHLSIDDQATGEPAAALLPYAGRITDIYRRYLVERAQYYGIERRWPDSPFWTRRQAHREALHHATSAHAPSA